MPEQRIAPVEPPFPPQVQEAFDAIMPPGMPPLNIFRTVANNERVLSRMVRGGLLDRGSISIAQRELVILRACALCDAEYEWGVHVAAYAGKAGFSPRQIEATRSSGHSDDIWSEEQRAVLTLVDELHTSAQIGDETWACLAAYFSADQIIELVMLAGLYHAVSFIVNGLRIECESFAPGFPAGGERLPEADRLPHDIPKDY